MIEVRDHGPGIPEDVLPHVFDRFYKASASRPRSEGSGLGLSIALENAHIHGGEITAANSAEGGAVFTLRLPRDASARSRRNGTTTRPPTARRAPRGTVGDETRRTAGLTRARRRVLAATVALAGLLAGLRHPGHARCRRTSARRPPGCRCALSDAGHRDAGDHARGVPVAGVPAVRLGAGAPSTARCEVPDGTAEAERRVLVAQGLLDELAATPSTVENEAGYTHRRPRRPDA